MNQITTECQLVIGYIIRKTNEYNLDKNIQRDKLIEEIETYGIDSFENKDIDKLRSLYYKELKFSKNQIGLYQYQE